MAGDLVYIKSEGEKFKGRERCIVTKIINDFASLQKITFSKFMSKQYRVPLNQIYPVMPLYSNHSIQPNISHSLNDDSDDHIEDRVPLDTVYEQPGNAGETLQGIRSNTK